MGPYLSQIPLTKTVSSSLKTYEERLRRYETSINSQSSKLGLAIEMRRESTVTSGCLLSLKKEKRKSLKGLEDILFKTLKRRRLS
jgi:hypothetical protein